MKTLGVGTLIRWIKFNAVGAMGVGVQLGVLALLNRLAPGHYLVATAAAIEITLLHNFMWHLRYTWRDRRDDATRLQQLVRFHLSNGAVSMVGNLGLMRLLVHGMRVPVVAANGIAIVCCSAVNFWMGDRWAFARKGNPDKTGCPGRSPGSRSTQSSAETAASHAPLRKVASVRASFLSTSRLEGKARP